MKLKHVLILVVVAALMASASVLVAGAGKSAVVSNGDLKWKDMGIPGVAAACVSGDMEKGKSRFYLKYPVGFVTPSHHHTADHYVTVVSGTITLTVDGKDHKLGPGSYFELLGAAPHTAKVEGNEAAVMFVEADSAWDVVMEK